ncbi:hypothetical protein Tco_0825492 [Tanacetum coccineum]
MGPERQPDAAAGALANAEDAPIIDEGGQADPTPVQAPQQPPLPPPAHVRDYTFRGYGILEGICLYRDSRVMAQLIDPLAELTYKAFDRSFRGASPLHSRGGTRQRTGMSQHSTG